MTGDGWAKGPDGIWAKGLQKAALTLKVDAGNPSQLLAAQLLAAQWQQAGFQLTVVPETASRPQAPTCLRATSRSPCSPTRRATTDVAQCDLWCSKNILKVARWRGRQPTRPDRRPTTPDQRSDARPAVDRRRQQPRPERPTAGRRSGPSGAGRPGARHPTRRRSRRPGRQHVQTGRRGRAVSAQLRDRPVHLPQHLVPQVAGQIPSLVQAFHDFLAVLCCIRPSSATKWRSMRVHGRARGPSPAVSHWWRVAPRLVGRPETRRRKLDNRKSTSQTASAKRVSGVEFAGGPLECGPRVGVAE